MDREEEREERGRRTHKSKKKTVELSNFTRYCVKTKLIIILEALGPRIRVETSQTKLKNVKTAGFREAEERGGSSWLYTDYH